MISIIDTYFYEKPEPIRSCLLFLRQLVLSQDDAVREVWRYKMPFYCIVEDDKNLHRFCYLWVDKKTMRPYIGIVDGKLITHPDLVREERSRMKVFYVDPVQDLPVASINQILQEAIWLIKNKI